MNNVKMSELHKDTAAGLGDYAVAKVGDKLVIVNKAKPGLEFVSARLKPYVLYSGKLAELIFSDGSQLFYGSIDSVVPLDHAYR